MCSRRESLSCSDRLVAPTASAAPSWALVQDLSVCADCSPPALTWLRQYASGDGGGQIGDNPARARLSSVALPYVTNGGFNTLDRAFLPEQHQHVEDAGARREAGEGDT